MRKAITVTGGPRALVAPGGTQGPPPRL